jgi:hypothetical protein
MMPQSVSAYIRTQGIYAAIINVVLNPVLAWLVNREMEFMPLSGGHGIVIDTAVTSVLLSLLVGLFAASGFHRDLRAGRVTTSNGFSLQRRLLARLPGRAWALGLMLGFGIAVVLVLLTLAVFHLLNISGIPFVAFALIKAVYTGLLAFVVTRWVIFRQLLLAPQT